MSALRLGGVNLAPKDTAYIRALVRLFAHTEKLPWVFVDQPPYQAMVADRTGRASDPVIFQSFDGPVLALVDPPGAPAADKVAYPVHAEQFREWLTLRQAGLLGAPAPGAAAPGAPQAQPAPAIVVAPQALPTSQAFEPSFKLRRWPSPALLQGDPVRTRIATLMARNALGMARLVALTGQPEACAQFVAQLHEAGLLVEGAPVEVPAPVGADGGAAAQAMLPSASSAPESAPAPSAAPVRLGLIASLRRHLRL